MIARFLADTRGTTAVEYAVIAGLIFMVIITAITQIGVGLNGIFGSAASAFPSP